MNLTTKTPVPEAATGESIDESESVDESESIGENESMNNTDCSEVLVRLKQL
jgi:hypothetical protein